MKEGEEDKELKNVGNKVKQDIHQAAQPCHPTESSHQPNKNYHIQSLTYPSQWIMIMITFSMNQPE